MRFIWPLVAMFFVACKHTEPKKLVVDVSDQKLYVEKGGARVAEHDCSTARRGTGQKTGSFKTPIGDEMRIVDKMPTGDPDYHGSIPGDKLWIAGADCPKGRYIYIHRCGRPSNLGTPVSNGCIHLHPDVLSSLFDEIEIGTPVEIIQ